MQSILRPRRLTGLPVLIVALGLLLWTSDCSSHYVELRRAQAQERSEVQQRGDTQQAVAVTSSERDAVRREMRTMMRSLNFVLQGLADGNVATIEQAARRSGKVTTLDGAFREKLPPIYRQLDQKIHLRLEQLADATKGSTAPPNVITRLAAITGYCVACHDMFRLDEIRESGERVDR